VEKPCLHILADCWQQFREKMRIVQNMAISSNAIINSNHSEGKKSSATPLEIWKMAHRTAWPEFWFYAVKWHQMLPLSPLAKATATTNGKEFRARLSKRTWKNVQNLFNFHLSWYDTIINRRRRCHCRRCISVSLWWLKTSARISLLHFYHTLNFDSRSGPGGPRLGLPNFSFPRSGPDRGLTGIAKFWRSQSGPDWDHDFSEQFLGKEWNLSESEFSESRNSQHFAKYPRDRGVIFY
jgi:hypothetical protein